MKAQTLWLGLAAIAALAGGALLATRHPPTGPAAITHSASVMAAVLPDLNGKPQAFSQWRGKVLVINFWATWCPPCREEIPGFIKLQNELANKGVQFVGIAIDQADKVNDFAKEFGVNYPMLLGEDNALELQSQLGGQGGALPFTVIVDPSGNIAVRHLGGWTADQIKPLLLALAQ